MNQARLVRLLIAHALAEGEPAGAVLRAAGLHGPAAAALDAGRLGPGLRSAGFPHELARLAEADPQALRDAETWLARIPSPWVLRFPLLATLGLLFVVARTQLLLAGIMGDRVLPPLQRALSEASAAAEPARPLADIVAWYGGIASLLAAFSLLLLLLLGLVTFLPPERNPFLARALRGARSAALAVARGGPPALAIEREAVFERSLARLSAAHHRLLAGLRTGGFGFLALLAAVLTGLLYRAFAEMSL